MKRSVIVAGGTMQPISEFREQLFQNAGADLSRILTFTYGHVVPSENILPIIVCNGPSGKQLDYSYQNRNTLALVRIRIQFYFIYLYKYSHLTLLFIFKDKRIGPYIGQCM